MFPMSAPGTFNSTAAAFFGGVRSAWTSVFFLVLAGTYIGIGALAHDYGFSLPWMMASTVLLWAGPAQVIMISALGAGATLFETALAVGLSGVRFLPMVVALPPLLRTAQTRTRDLLLPAHFTAASMWVECCASCRAAARAARCVLQRVSVGYQGTAATFGLVGYYLAAGLPPLSAGALLFLTPMSFLISTARNARQMVDRLALVLGLRHRPRC